VVGCERPGAAFAVRWQQWGYMTASPDNLPADTLWLGVHKTGTTFLQKSLDLSQGALQAGGVQYQELSEFRTAYTRPLLAAGHPDAPAQPWGAAGKRLIFDENILGLVQHALGPLGLYPEAAARARIMADHFGMVRPQIVLGLRGFGGFLPSLYCEALKSTAFRRFRKFCVTPVEALSWDDLVGRIMAVFPGSEVWVYTAEALRGHEAALLAAVTGLGQAAFTLLDQAERPGFSHKAVRAMHEIDKTSLVTRADISQQNKLFPRRPGVAGFNPWTPEEAAVLDQVYAADVARVVKRAGVRFLDTELAAL
jgi:hypothetical protein